MIKIDNILFLITILAIFFASLGALSLIKQFSPSVLEYPNHSGVHEIYDGNRFIGNLITSGTTGRWNGHYASSSGHPW